MVLQIEHLLPILTAPRDQGSNPCYCKYYLEGIVSLFIMECYYTFHNKDHWDPGRDSGNDFSFPDFALHNGCFRLIFVRISSVVSFRFDIRQLSLFLICCLFLFNQDAIFGSIPVSIRLDTMTRSNNKFEIRETKPTAVGYPRSDF